MKNLKISSMSPQPLIIIMAIATLFAVPLRTFQLANCIDPKTGFWLVKDFTEPLLYVLCGIVIVTSLFISFFSGIMPKPELSSKRSIPIGTLSILFAVTFVVDSIMKMSSYITLIDTYVVETHGTFFGYLMKSGVLALILQSVFGLLSAIYLFTVGLSFLSEKPLYEKGKLLALSPVIWAICRMIFYFVQPISYKNVSQLLLQLILISIVMIFFLSFARIASKVNEESSMWILWFSGAAGAFMAYVCALAPLVLLLTGKGDLIPIGYPIQYTDLAFAFFATALLLRHMPRTVKNHTEDA